VADAVRTRDVIETGPRHTPADVIRLNTRFAGAAPAEMLRRTLTERLTGRTAVVSSFGAESAVLLHMVASIDPATPVIFLDTLKHFPETLAYRDQLIARLGLTDVRTIYPDAERLAARDATELRWSYDPDGCCEIRKVEPLARALADFDATVSGRKGFQSATRTHIPSFELDTSDTAGRIKINPLAGWTKADLDAYFEAHDLPRHPLEAEGYPSIGCSPCTSVVQAGEDPRAGRWRGWDKVECGIHTPAEGPDQPSF
jgi:phosphoadenosine phosphosulfate reductase